MRHLRPRTLAEALRLLDELDESATPFTLIAGATDVVSQAKITGRPTGTLVSLTLIEELRGIHRGAGSDSTLRIGALTSVADLASDPSLPPGLAEAARMVASPQIRNRASVGGNLLADRRCVFFNQSDQSREAHGSCFKAGGDACHLVPGARPPGEGPQLTCRARLISDLAPCLIALDAKILVAWSRGTRTLPLAELYRPDGIDRHSLSRREIILSIEIARADAKALHYEKLRIRNTLDFPSLGVALAREKNLGSTQLTYRLALTGLDGAAPPFSGMATHEQASDLVLRLASSHPDRQTLKQIFFAQLSPPHDSRSGGKGYDA